MNPEENPREHYPDIPEVFRNEEGEYFDHCISCNNELLESEESYIIERAIKKYRKLNTSIVIFEYAICIQCATKMNARLSEESLKNIQKFMSTKVRTSTSIFSKLDQAETFNYTELLDKCLITGKNIDDDAVSEYQLIAHCEGNKLIPWEFPFMISGEALEEISELLSEKTRDELDDFIDDHFGLPPEWKEAIKKRDAVLI